MKHIHCHEHSIRRRAWKHRIAIHHINRALPVMEKAYLSTSLISTKLIIAIHEMKLIRIEEKFAYKDAQRILKKCVLFTA
uniref:Uncharacterized protein n=1 Tax=Solanum tuberosum TaxID=4113 RepID=M1CU81_SOLTU